METLANGVTNEQPSANKTNPSPATAGFFILEIDMKVEAQITHEFDVAAIKVSAEVRYWEDAQVGSVVDVDGSKIPLRNGDCWEPVIDLDTGRIRNWPDGVVASVHYKVCDAGVYELLDAQDRTIAVRDGYVPDILSPAESGYGDYIILNIGGDGVLAEWRADIDPEDWKWKAPSSD